jgi:hypothetical protein
MNAIKTLIVIVSTMFVSITFAQTNDMGTMGGIINVDTGAGTRAVPAGTLPTSPTDAFEVRMKTNDTTPETVAKRKAVTQQLLAKDKLKVTSFVVIGATSQKEARTYYAYPKEGRFDFFLETNPNTLCTRGGVMAKYYVHEDGWLVIEMDFKEKPALWDCGQDKIVFDTLTGEGRDWYAPRTATTASEYKPGRAFKLLVE